LEKPVSDKKKKEIAAGKCVMVPVFVPDSMIESLLVDCEDATAYWCGFHGERPTYEQMKVLGVGMHLKTHEDTGDKEVEKALKNDWKPDVAAMLEKLPDTEETPKFWCLDLTAAKIQKGLQVMAADYPHRFVDIMKSDTDQDTADILVQCAVFGKAVFG
jgi:hypothetical protein